MTAYDASEWSDFFVAGAGASAALAGLVFVAVSINVERILSFKGLPERALETVLTLLSVVLVSLIALLPGLSPTALGAVLLVESLAFAGITSWLAIKSMPEGPEKSRVAAGRITLRAMATLPLIVGAASLLAESGGGLYWIAAGMLFAIAGAVANAWVLLVEILR